jgi:hypothetical protein
VEALAAFRNIYLPMYSTPPPSVLIYKLHKGLRSLVSPTVALKNIPLCGVPVCVALYRTHSLSDIFISHILKEEKMAQ